MAETSAQVEIPNRPLFKASEVCDLAKVQPYVLRSWEAEFKDLGVTRNGSSGRVYRREDVERVLRIKHLLLSEGLTLAGVRRKLEEESEPALDLELPLPAPVAALAPDVRERIGVVKQGLRSLLTLLDAPLRHDAATIPAEPQARELALFADAEPDDDATRPTRRRSSRASGSDAAKSASPRRQRSA
ncbi:MAG: MerR family transcriptional regulator [Vicinamibacterales bacterium]